MKITIKNRLAVLIRMRGLRSASEFGRRMTEAGFAMSSSHASRFEKDDMPATELRFINAACNVLQCLPDDLYDIVIELGGDEELDPSIAIPRHAVIRRADEPMPTQAKSADTPTRAKDASAQTVATGPKAKVSSQRKAIDPDTGPKVTLFPYGKN